MDANQTNSKRNRVRLSGGEEGLIIIDDTIEEKPIRRGGQMKTKLSVGIMITARANQSKE
jgi:hypothetical protein